MAALNTLPTSTGQPDAMKAFVGDLSQSPALASEANRAAHAP